MKRLPSITTLPKDENTFVKVLSFIKENGDPIKFEEFLKTEFGFSDSGAKKMRNSLGKFNFIFKKGDKQILSDISYDFINGHITFDEFIYKILASTRFEMKTFICDLVEILKEENVMDKKEILSEISNLGYKAHLSTLKESSQIRNLNDILKMASYAKIVSKTEDGKYKIGSRGNLYRQESMEKDFFNELRSFIRKYAFNSDVLTDSELLRLHRLLLRAQAIGGVWGIETQIKEVKEFMNSERIKQRIKKYNKKKRRKRKHLNKKITSKSLWSLRPDIRLYKWQEECLKSWFNNGKRGVVEVVTGAGKTFLALAAIQEIKKREGDIIVSIIVPTKALMYQWRENLVVNFQMSEDDIGLRGDGHHDTFENGKKIIIYTYNSAVLNHNLANDINSVGNTKHFMIVDECHRSGSPEFKRIYNAKYDYAIGLSATPERPTDDVFRRVIEPKLGKIIFRYTFKEALDDKIIPPFEIFNYAILLTPSEQKNYDRLTDDIRRTVKKIKNRYYERLRGSSEDLFEAMLRKIQSELEVPDADITNYFIKTNERKRELYIAENRWKCVEEILKENEGRKIILFHENIWAVDQKIYGMSDLARKPIVLYHSGLPPKDNEIALELYRRNVAKILVSVKALIEGLDVPDTDIGIIVASSSSPTQRIQSMGRILRQTARKREEGLSSKLYVIYVKDTTDERIFSRIDWSSIADEKSIHYILWTPDEKKIIEPPIPSKFREIPCEEVDASKLTIGDVYPGKFGGFKLSCDHRGKIFKRVPSGREYFEGYEWDKIAKRVIDVKPTGGVFVINDCGHILIKSEKEGKLVTLFLGITNILKEVNKK